ncbi:MAG: hypothetical protein IPJ65_25020 [Archangiaceae bacterium]|nr:hypothetical protein [Archangiaceae bacterium]
MNAKLFDAAFEAGDDENFVLELEPSVGAEELRRLKNAFEESSPGIPVQYATAELFPIRARCTNAQSRFTSYESKLVPASDIARMSVLASGSVAGRGFTIANPGGEGENNELMFLKAGTIQGGAAAEDRLVRFPLPDDLAQANRALYSAKLDDHHLLLTGVSVPEDLDGAPTMPTYILDARIRDPKRAFEKVEGPPVALVDAGLGAVGGKAVLMGGREVFSDGEGWVPSLDLAEAHDLVPNELPYVFDGETKTWSPMDRDVVDPSITARAGYAVATVGDQVLFAGGITVEPGENGVYGARASREVDAFDAATGRVVRHSELAVPVSHATAVNTPSGLELLGGLEHLSRGLEPSPMETVQRLTTKGGEAKWKERTDQTLPQPAAGLAAVPRADGSTVVGPFYDEAAPLDPIFSSYGPKKDGQG